MIHEFISDQGSMYLNLYLLFLSSKVRWRNTMCFITKPSNLVPKTRDLDLWSQYYSDLVVEVATGHLYTRMKKDSLHAEDTIPDANWDATTALQRIVSPRR